MDIIEPLIWMGGSKRDLLAMPPSVVDVFGYALYLAQCGQRHPAAKVLKGFGDASVLEVVESTVSGAYRLVYTTRFRQALIVLHAFQKKSKSGIATPRTDLELIRDRLRAAERVVRSNGS